jgi:hypothetical protein
MANGIDWFRWHHGSVNDPKFGLVAKKAGARVGDVIAVWALMLEQASANTSAARAATSTAMQPTSSWALKTAPPPAFWKQCRRGLIADGRIVRWEDRQPKRERVDTTAAERKRAQRERERDNTPMVTWKMSHQVTPRHTKSRLEKRRVEKN